MATPIESVTNAAALAAANIIKSAANARFIADADIAIASAASQGKLQVCLSSLKDMSFKDVSNYYVALGYKIGMYGCTWGNCQPSNLFGQFWLNYWNNNQICTCTPPCKIIILWQI